MEFDGERLARRGIVVVTVNYRLNVFGFLPIRSSWKKLRPISAIWISSTACSGQNVISRLLAAIRTISRSEVSLQAEAAC